MSGRHAFSLPEPRARDGWFRIGTIDISTTILVVGLGLASMFLYALSPEVAFKGAFVSALVRQGEVWRVATWPLVNPPDFWILIGLAVFWWLGHAVEDVIGRKPFTVLLGAMTVIPAIIVTLLNVANEGTAKWAAYSYSVSLLSLGLIVVFSLEHPTAKFFNVIPIWALAAGYVFVDVLAYLGDRAFAQLTLLLLVIAVGCIGARQRGMLEIVSFIPRVKALGGPPPSPYGEIGGARPKKVKGQKRRKGAPGPSVVQGPWNQTGGPTPLEQAELDVLLDRISEGGIDSLTKHEKARLNDLSRRMRDS